MAYESNNPQKSRKSSKKSEGASNARQGFTHQFVRYTPDKEDKGAVKSFDFSSVNWFEWYDRLVDDGYKVSFNLDRAHDCVVASLTCNNEKSVNNGYILTARGADTGTAAAWLHWLHNIRFEGEWGKGSDDNWSLD